jgi:hypothetical protein
MLLPREAGSVGQPYREYLCTQFRAMPDTANVVLNGLASRTVRPCARANRICMIAADRADPEKCWS